MLTLENIGLNEDGVVEISFSYEGESVNFKGQMKMTPKEFMASRGHGDVYLAECILQRELNWWINK
ncbi:hypothetical protein [Neobacillus sp. PS3-40]|uniref:hypothetical protein n=1 Tax=Neobacillus sp. PS3-40 TaxID=3070679 RepID=UPI0027DF1361|nr:hypothetical protein [Neobacillus sp. PS3-40]WML44075.1 hypothetical protein RCG20_20215 [Neobacillus sp. PS3-40]